MVVVYALTNPAMPGLVKIGKTDNEDFRVRVGQLYSTGVPLPFELVRAVKVQDMEAAERRVHDVFASSRINPKREFFEIDVEQVHALFDLLVSGGNEEIAIEESVADEVDADSLRAADSFKKRRPNLNFGEMGIPVGAELVFRSDESVIVVVVDDKRVRLGDEEVFLSRATKIARGSETSVDPTGQWYHEGRLLSEIYWETYGG